MTLGVGEVFAGYTVVRQIGSGGMGEVYLASHPRLPRREALKILRTEISSDESFRERFVREADSIAALEHPNIVTVHDRGDTDGRLWIATQFVDGTDAAELLRDHPTGIPIKDAIAITTAIADALDFANHHGLIHRDIKPANILLAHPGYDGTRRIYLADFGIARPLEDPVGLTATNFTLGTFAYAAPEQLNGDYLDGRADQYALAATAYHLLTGTTLFPVTNPVAAISRHLTAPPPKLSARHQHLAPMDDVLAKALSKNPAGRYLRCADFARALAEAAGGTTSAISPTAPTQQAPIAPQPERIPEAGLRTSAPKPAASKSPAKPPHQEFVAPGRSRKTATPPDRFDPVGGPESVGRKRGLVAIAGAGAAVVGIVLLIPLGIDTGSSEQNLEAARTTPSSQQPPVPLTTKAIPSVSTSTVAGTAGPTTPAAASEPTWSQDAYRYALPGCYQTDSPPLERPAVLPFQTCADGSQRLEAMSWSSWGQAGAQGTGTFSFKVCEPTCAQGHRAQYGVTVSAFNPAPAPYNSGCPTDVMFYSEMIVAFPATPPTDIAVETTYLGRPAIRFTTSPDAGPNSFLGNQLCY